MRSRAKGPHGAGAAECAGGRDPPRAPALHAGRRLRPAAGHAGPGVRGGREHHAHAAGRLLLPLPRQERGPGRLPRPLRHPVRRSPWKLQLCSVCSCDGMPCLHWRLQWMSMASITRGAVGLHAAVLQGCPVMFEHLGVCAAPRSCCGGAIGEARDAMERRGRLLLRNAKP